MSRLSCLPRLSRRSGRTCSLILLAVTLLMLAAGCGVENLSGVDLATSGAEPTATTAMTAETPTPNPAALVDLPNTAEKEFLGTVLTMHYPEGWDTQEGGQSLNIFPTNGDGFGVAIFVSLTRTTNVDRDEERVAPLVMAAFLQNAAQGGFVPEESAPTADSAYAFEWGPRAAALYAWQGADDNTNRGLTVVVMDDNRDRFVTLFVQGISDIWLDYAPIWQAMLGSVTLDGVALPGEDLWAAYAAAQAES